MITRCYAIADPNAFDTVYSALTGLFKDIREEVETTTFEVMDSFDWRLFNKGWLMFKSHQRYETIDIHTGQRVGTIVVETQKPPRFSWEFPESDFTAALTEVLEMRALITLLEITKRSVRYDLRNRDEKIVARLVLETVGVDGGAETVNQGRLVPVRGYTNDAKRVVDCLEQLGLQPAIQSPVLDLLVRQGLSPGNYSSKINISLTPETPAAEAVRCIMVNLISVMQMNIPGIRQDIDTEFLHDFRVSVRRARSLLSQIKGVLDTETTANLQQRLKAMGAITGNVRDLDVYLLEKTEYIDRVPDFLKPGIIQLFRTLQRKRRYAKDRMVKAMDGIEFETTLSDLDAIVQSDPLAGFDAPEGARPIGQLAQAVIYKRYRRVIKKGSRISDTTPDERLHELRIDCKKLRYLLEFFTSLFPEDQMKILVKQLKQLQENLGYFNDLSVQQEFLTNYLQTITPQTAQAVMLAAATGGLITRLHLAHQLVRSQFLSVFKKFNAPENQQRFETLFA
jgi:CHAD domain-containing protein